MRSLILREPGRADLVEVATPSPGPGEVLVRNEFVGICRTDRKCFAIGQRDLQLPRVLGHEIVGTIAAIGPDPVLGEFAPPPVGTRVAVHPGVPCGRCTDCLAGQDQVCLDMQIFGFHVDGGFAEYTLIPAAGVRVGVLNSLPDDLPAHLGVLTEPLACAVNLANRLEFRPGESLLLIGAGVLGTLLATLARISGVEDIVLLDVDPAKVAAVGGIGFEDPSTSSGIDPRASAEPASGTSAEPVEATSTPDPSTSSGIDPRTSAEPASGTSAEPVEATSTPAPSTSSGIDPRTSAEPASGTSAEPVEATSTPDPSTSSGIIEGGPEDPSTSSGIDPRTSAEPVEATSTPDPSTSSGIERTGFTAYPTSISNEELLAGRPGFSVAVATCPGTDAFERCAMLLSKRGRLGVFSGLTSGQPINQAVIDAIHYRELAAYGSYGCGLAHSREALRLLQAHPDAFSFPTTFISLDAAAGVLAQTEITTMTTIDFRSDNK